MYLKKFFLIFMVSITLVSCSSTRNTTVGANSIETRLIGTIENTQVVTIEGDSSWVGSVPGSIVGGLLGGAVGNGWWRVVSSLTGSVIGSYAGTSAEKRLTRKEGLKLSIREDSGSLFTITTVPKKGEFFNVGDRVEVISSDGSLTVMLLDKTK